MDVLTRAESFKQCLILGIVSQNPQVYLKPGDVVTLGIEGLGDQRQTFVADS